MKGSRLFLASGLLSILLTADALSQEWPRFRGPNGSGLSTAATVPAKWTEKDFNWKLKLLGKGHSSPVVWGKKVFITCADEKTGKRVAVAVDANSGQVLWQREFPGAKTGKHQDNSFASATPAADAKHLYLCWGNAKEYLVVALDHDGKEIWRRDLGPFKAGHGFGASPIVHGEILVVPNDQDGPSSLVGLDRTTGAMVWKVPRQSKSTYSTPCVYQPPGGQAELIFTSYEHGVTSIDPKTGQVNWELDVFHKGHIESAIGSPVIAGDLILAPCGWLAVHHEVVAVRPPAPGLNTTPKKLYDLHKSAPLCTTPLVKDNLLFLWSDLGVVTCADLQTGKVHWQQRVAGSYYSSPVCAGENIFNVARDGEVVVLAAAKKYQPLAQNQIGEGTHATPALAHGRMYVRTFSQLLSVGGKKPA